MFLSAHFSIFLGVELALIYRFPCSYKEQKMTGKRKTWSHGLHAKKVVSDGPGLVDFALGLLNSVFNLPDGQVMLFEEFE